MARECRSGWTYDWGHGEVSQLREKLENYEKRIATLEKEIKSLKNHSHPKPIELMKF